MYVDKGYGIHVDELERNHPLPKGYGKRLYDHIRELPDTSDVTKYISELVQHEKAFDPDCDTEDAYDRAIDEFENNSGESGIWAAICTAISLEQEDFYTDEFVYTPDYAGLYCRFFLPQDEKAKTKMPTLLDVQDMINKYLDILYDHKRPEIPFETIIHAENVYDLD